MKKYDKAIDGKRKYAQATSIYDLLGVNPTPYGTRDPEVYDKKLSAMNLSDLQQHAIEVGLKPLHDRRPLTERLMRQFKQTVSSYHAAKKQKAPLKGEEKSIAEKIMSRGR